jgi:hypothetical protein
MPRCLAAAFAVLLSAAALFAQRGKLDTAPPNAPSKPEARRRDGEVVHARLAPASAAAPAASATITLHGRHGHATPVRQGCTHTGAGNIDVSRPSPDTVVITMTGVAVATGHPCTPSVAGLDFDLEQCFEVILDNPEVMRITLIAEARVIGLLRSHCKGGGSAEVSGACATVACGPTELLTVCAPARSVAGGENLSINDHDGPVSQVIAPGKYTLHQKFHLCASHPKAILPCKAASAEFAPEPALDPLWISAKEPFKGAQKKEFGFQVTLKVATEGVKQEQPAGKPDKIPETKPKP